MKRLFILKRIMALMLSSVLLLSATFMAVPLNAYADGSSSSSATSPVSHQNYFNNVYRHLNDPNSVFQTATYEDIINVFKTSGTFAVLVGGRWSDATQADIGFIDQVAKQDGVTAIYNWDTRLDDNNPASDLDADVTSNVYSYYYADVVNTYLTNLTGVSPAFTTVNWTHTYGGAAHTGTVPQIQEPFLLVYNSTNPGGPIVSYLESSSKYGDWSDFLNADGSLNTTAVNNYESTVDNVFRTGSSTGYSTIDNTQYLGNAFDTDNGGVPPIFGSSNGGSPPISTIDATPDAPLVFEHVTYDELTNILGSSGTYVFLFGGSWCPNTQAAIKWINLYAKQYNIDKIYMWDPKLNDGISIGSTDGTLDGNNVLQCRKTGNLYAYMYVNLVNTYLTNLQCQDTVSANGLVGDSVNPISYTDASGQKVSANRLQVPYVFVYNKDNLNSQGVSAPIIGNIELMYAWPSILTTTSDAYELNTYTQDLASGLFARLAAVPTGLTGIAPTTSADNDGQIAGTIGNGEYQLSEAYNNTTPPYTTTPKWTPWTSATSSPPFTTAPPIIEEYQPAAATTWTAVYGTSITGLASGTYNVRYAATNGYDDARITFPYQTDLPYLAGASVPVVVPNQDQAAPRGLAGIAPTSSADNNGEITGTQAGEGYHLSGGLAWTPVTGTAITGLASGTYYVEWTAKTGYNASPATEVSVPAYLQTSGGGSSGGGGSSSNNSGSGAVSTSGSGSVSNPSGSAPQGFGDVPASYWAYAAISSLSSKGIISGYPDGTFKPDAVITRAEFAAMLVKALGLSTVSTTGQFTDVAGDDWCYNCVNTAVYAGLVSGLGHNLFAPNAPITREQMAMMVAKALGTKAPVVDGTELNAFSDRSAVGSWAVTALAEAVKAGIVNGITTDTLAPQADATRAQAAVIIYKLLVILGKQA